MGLEPVTVAVESPTRVWVVNHLGDSISIVDLVTRNVVATVVTGDEPTDALFTPDPTSPAEQWAWVCISGTDEVQVFDAETPALPLYTLAIFGVDPRTMAYDRQRNRVYVAAFGSGNRTTIVPRTLVHDPLAPWGGELPPFVPPLAADLRPVPDNGVIVRWKGSRWLDEQDGDWTPLVPWRLADEDVFQIEVAPTPTVVGAVSGVGTLLFDIAVAPASGDVFVTNLEAMNHVLFEPKLRGRFVRNQMTRIPSGSGLAETVHLNSHIDYDGPGDPGERALSLSQPGAMAIRSDGGEIFFTAMGSALLGVADGRGNVMARRPFVEGASGIVLDEPRDLLYIANRFTNRVHLMRASSGAILGDLPIGLAGWDPTPAVVRNGRRFLYAGALSAHGDAACASCHAFADTDHLAWDLGDPTGVRQPPPPPEENGGIVVNGFHPLKGPMATQTLRGLPGTGFLHWRGDRRDFPAFNRAFVNLMGAEDTLSAVDMQAFTDFVMTVTYPPNPDVRLDNTLDSEPPEANAETGLIFFEGSGCMACHDGLAGTNGFIMARDQMPGAGGQVLKVPQLRNLYTKLGFSAGEGGKPGQPGQRGGRGQRSQRGQRGGRGQLGELKPGQGGKHGLPGAEPAPSSLLSGVGGVVKRGFGFTHDGAFPTISEFLDNMAMPGDNEPHIEAFLLSFPTGTAAAVGHQVTLGPGTAGDPEARATIATLEAQAEAGSIELVVKGVVGGEVRGYWFDGGAGSYRPDRAGEPTLKPGSLLAAVAAGAELTWLGVPPLTGERVGIDRDLDGWRDRDELDRGTSPADPASIPSGIGPQPPTESQAPGARTELTSIVPNPFNPATTVRFALGTEGPVFLAVHDVTGRRVRLLSHAVLAAGDHAVRWDGRADDGRPAASGVYLISLKTGAGTDTKKVVLAR